MTILRCVSYIHPYIAPNEPASPNKDRVKNFVLIANQGPIKLRYLNSLASISGILEFTLIPTQRNQGILIIITDLNIIKI